MGDTKIEWTEKTWNPIRARRKSDDSRGWYCELVSEGCRNCYAEKMNRNTYFGNGLPYKPATLPEVDLFLDDKILQQPLHWSKPQNVFPCSMTDLFGRWAKDEWLDRIFAVMALAQQHTFQVLTKRPERMRDYLSGETAQRIAELIMLYRFTRDFNSDYEFDARDADLDRWPLPNVHLGTSVENQKTADERIPLLLQTPAAVRWISAEPLLGPVDLRNLKDGTFNGLDGIDYEDIGDIRDAGILSKSEIPKLDWLVCGGESGPKARPMHPDWVRGLRDQCVSAGIPFFFKQWGGWANQGECDDPCGRCVMALRSWNGTEWRGSELTGTDWKVGHQTGALQLHPVGKKAAGRLLDGREWSEYPKAKSATAKV